jgi:lysophospholipase L1-like esterase
VDNWHPNALGHRLAAAAVRDWLASHEADLFPDSVGGR